ncbi:MAG: hypothetical protein HY878_05950 [Deltaproteobacteria bacterium]|nr:hypothetical protein [Deltaproteobacteria bacterium]
METILAYLLILIIVALVLNLPFGYLRAKSRRYSLRWFFYIHLPIPFIILLRWVLGVDYRGIPVVVLGAIMGQFLGGRFKP